MPMPQDPASDARQPKFGGLIVVLMAGLAGAMGWGIRGQFGHETGAMIAGALVSLTILLGVRSKLSTVTLFRAAAMGTIAIGFGGSMTYGQTVGLTHDAPLVGNWEALRWGMIGLAIKGGLWIGFAGTFMGMGLGGKRYRVGEMLLVMLGLILCFVWGVEWLNRPFDPANRLLPAIYFSDSWYWEPDANLKPRAEVWGGYFLGYLVLTLYLGFVRRDGVACTLGFWGLMGGGLGFPLGQSLQAWHAWNLTAIRAGGWGEWDKVMNWWNWMETTFGLVMGATLGLGVWLHRHRLKERADASAETMPLSIMAIGLLVGHALLLVHSEFGLLQAWEANIPGLNWLARWYDQGLVLAIIPLLAVACSRWGSLGMVLPIVAIPIVGKSYREMVIKSQEVSPAIGGWTLVLIPMLLLTSVMLWIGWQSIGGGKPLLMGSLGRSGLRGSRWPLAMALAANVLVYGWLNQAFFRNPWPWREWTARTPNGLFFTFCGICLLVFAWRQGVRNGDHLTTENSKPLRNGDRD